MIIIIAEEILIKIAINHMESVLFFPNITKAVLLQCKEA
jgi:hypothetical protein